MKLNTLVILLTVSVYSAMSDNHLPDEPGFVPPLPADVIPLDVLADIPKEVNGDIMKQAFMPSLAPFNQLCALLKNCNQANVMPANPAPVGSSAIQAYPNYSAPVAPALTASLASFRPPVAPMMLTTRPASMGSAAGAPGRPLAASMMSPSASILSSSAPMMSPSAPMMSPSAPIMFATQAAPTGYAATPMMSTPAPLMYTTPARYAATAPLSYTPPAAPMMYTTPAAPTYPTYTTARAPSNYDAMTTLASILYAGPPNPAPMSYTTMRAPSMAYSAPATPRPYPINVPSAYV